ncbi:LPXTG cell wall anchor domain-containing protein [Demequina sediminicola]|uniref:LPXTG cell wall anchor domain-containing protein n=1 Tax=Demequina sediminicola TaxID=1095026 RepID=UPI00191BD3BA|nr:LPXTG cell wall anchor domain-containing protein [Demequina sediminicola]
MIRRTLAVGALTVAAFAVPAAAMADTYPAQDAQLVCSSQETPMVTEFTCTVTGEAGHDATIQTEFAGHDASIAGATMSSTQTMTDGTATWTITAPDQTGPITITGFDTTAEITTNSATVMVVDNTSADGDNLPVTGAENTGLLIAGAVALVGAGGAVVVLAMRRRNTDDEA